MSNRKYAAGYSWFRSFAVLLLIAMLLPTGSVFAGTAAQDQDLEPYMRRLPVEGAESQLPVAEEAFEPLVGNNLIQDPSFESSFMSSTYWQQFSARFGSPLCTDAFCGDGNGTAGPRSGSVWAWLGGVTNNESAYVQQTVTFPACGAPTLQFYLWIGFAQTGSGTNDFFYVTVDGNTVFTANATQRSSYTSYTPVSINLSAYANGAPHLIRLGASTTVQLVTFNVDDISLTSNTNCISGTVGVGGATLTYNDAGVKSVISQPNGNYSLPISDNWTGTVTPTHPCYTFSPTNRSYNNVVASQANQNYTPTFTPTLACKVTVGVFRPANGLLYLRNSNTTGFADVAINYGIPGDYPVVGDWDGDGDDTIGVYRNGSFLLRNSNTIGFADINIAFGIPGDQPIAGDWDGDGDDTIGVFRPSTGQFLLRNSNTTGTADISFFLGNPGDIGIAGDWDGDGDDTTGVFRPVNGVIFLKNTHTSGFADIAINYGIPGDRPVVGDWDGDGDDTIGVYRNGRFLLRNSNTIGFADISVDLGIPGDMPIAGDWDDRP